MHRSGSPTDSSLYSLVTDHLAPDKSSVVEERLEDVDGGTSFLNNDHTAEDALRAAEIETGRMTPKQPPARQIPAEEDNRVQMLRESHRQRQ
ncbi:hypothetical protein C8R47DRAFT_1214339 [Mycena vitilis]|nr:hypothetical protein C8R47DRAFT_1214339 [Mycena vitilis]